MRKNLFQLSLLCLWYIFTLCSCTDSEDSIFSTDGTVLTVHATANGFSSADGADTRTSEDGYTTQFDNGDKIGVFAVDESGNIKAGYNNLELTYQNGDWVTTDNEELYYYSGATYFAYYPYDNSMKDKKEVGEIVSAFTPQTDQSTYENYTKSDLMAAEGTVASSINGMTLNFEFKHQMSLIEISLPGQRYRTPDGYEYSSPVTGTMFCITSSGGVRQQQSVIPYHMGGGVYRYMVPNGSYTVSGKFQTANDKIIEYSHADIVLPVGSYHRENVTYTGSDSPVTRSLAVGDFYYSDGSICPADATAPPQEGCIGIVMKVGRERDGQWADNGDYRDKDGKSMDVHGYVLALHDGNGGDPCAWGFSTEVVGTKPESFATHFCGYSNTQEIKNKAVELGQKLQSIFPAAYHASEGYEKQYPSPRNSSGWFLPSVGQCLYWFDQSGPLKISMDKVVGDEWQNYYWSSSESSDNPEEVNAWYVDFDNGNVDSDPKDDDSYNGVRPCLAF